MKIVITGGCGFAGHHVVEHFLKNTDWEIIVFDKLTYAADGFNRVRDIEAYDNKRVRFVTYDLSRPISDGIIQEYSDVDYILHMAAETHVDNSIRDPKDFVYANVVGTFNILEFARRCDSLKAFLYFSTDEVFGPAKSLASVDMDRRRQFDLNAYREWDRYNSTNPYSATKAGGEELTLAYMNSYGLPGFITHTMNLFGERQHPEKFIPICIRKILAGENVTIHGTPDKSSSGSRFYIHCRNMANAIHWLFDRFTQREKYNIVGEKEVSNLELAQLIADILGKPLKYEIVDFHSSRPGHDLRYALDGYKLEQMGFKIPLSFEKSLESTVNWTLKNDKWLYLKGPKGANNA